MLTFKFAEPFSPTLRNRDCCDQLASDYHKTPIFRLSTDRSFWRLGFSSPSSIQNLLICFIVGNRISNPGFNFFSSLCPNSNLNFQHPDINYPFSTPAFQILQVHLTNPTYVFQFFRTWRVWLLFSFFLLLFLTPTQNFDFSGSDSWLRFNTGVLNFEFTSAILGFVFLILNSNFRL